MKNTILIIFALAYSSILFSQDLIGEIKIEKGEKNITNLSGKLNDSISFHLIINKLTKTRKYKSELFFFNQKKQIKSTILELNKKKPNFITFHVNNDILTFTKELKSGVVVYDYNYTSEKLDSVKVSVRPKAVFPLNNVIYISDQLIKTSNILRIIKIKTANDITNLLISPKTKDEISLLKNFKGKDFDFINHNQFIEKGSIKKYKGFYNENDLIFTKDIKKQSKVILFTVNNVGKVTSKEFIIKQGVKSKKLNSFIIDEKLFIFNMYRKKAYLHVYNIETSKLIKTFDYSAEKFGSFNKVVVNGNKSTTNYKPKKFYNSFFPQAIGSMYVAELYIGVNKSQTNDYIVQIGHVDKNKFNNNSIGHDWWSYPAFSINYSITNGSILGSFNPTATASLMIFDALAEIKRKGNYFEIDLEQNTLDKKTTQTPKFYHLDINKYNGRMNRLLKLNKYFYIEMKNHIRLINFDKISKKYKIYNITKL